MRKIIISAAVSIIIVLPAWGQAPDAPLDRQVDVSREFTPDVERAAKLEIAPDMTDTVSLRPEFDYSIRPSAWVTGFGVEAINPARVDPTSYDRLYPFYLKAGGGYPGQTMLDLYATTVGKGVNSAGIYFNHYGQYPDIKNDMGDKKGAMTTTNRGGIFGKIGFYRYTLAGEAGLEHGVWTRYGMYALEGRPLTNYGGRSPIQGFLTPYGNISIGNDFSDLSYFNFRVNAGVYRIGDRTDNAEVGFNAGLELGKSFDGHRVYLKGEFQGRRGKKDLADTGTDIIVAGPRYELFADGLKITAGAYVGYDSPKGAESKTWFLPQASLSFDFADGYFVPFVNLESRLTDNGYRRLAGLNPYIGKNPTLPGASAEYRLTGGFRGDVASAFSYRIYGGGERLKRMPFFYNNYSEGNTSDFGVDVEQRISSWLVGAELEGRLTGSLSILVSGVYHDYEGRTFGLVYSLPEYEIGFGVRYNWRKLLTVGLGLDVTGSRYFAQAPAGTGSDRYDVAEQKAVFDLAIEAEYALNKNISVFIEGHNLTGSKLYPFNHYPDIGARVSVGAKLLF